MSRNRKATELLEQHRERLSNIKHVYMVVSNDNPADPGSRGEPYCSDRESRMWQALHSEDHGVLWASERKNYKDERRDSTTRHDAPDDVDALDDMFVNVLKDQDLNE